MSLNNTIDKSYSAVSVYSTVAGLPVLFNCARPRCDISYGRSFHYASGV